MRQSLGRQPGIFGELLELFISEGHERVRRLGEALGRDDPAAAVTLAHGLRGSSSSFGALRLAGLCREFERVGQAKDLAGLRDAFPALEAEMAAVESELRSALA